MTLPWSPPYFGGLSLGLAAVHVWLATTKARWFERVVWIGLAMLWILSALSALYTSPQYNIRVDWLLFQYFALPFSVTAHAGLVAIEKLTDR